jgi:thiol-disulfide isomerase/thioredoxin
MSMSLFQNSEVYELTDDDFDFSSDSVTTKSKHFKGNNGYIMFYAPWCPHCQEKQDLWSYLGEQFNKNKAYSKEKFKIGAVNTTDENTSKVSQELGVNAIPKFFHAMKDGSLSEYNGNDLSIEGLVGAVCEKSPGESICKLKL